MPFREKRIYDAASADDGVRVLVERLWPRGVSKQRAAPDDWLKPLAPSTDLRRWFDHDATRWAEFKKRYALELRGSKEFEALVARGADQLVTLVYSSREEEFNNAVALRELLERAQRPSR